jgi:hypothetical protein
MNPDHDILRDRIRQCVPLRHPAFGKLLQLLSIEISDSVPTAAVTTGERSRLLVNSDFVARRCRSDAHLAMLVMHELYHVLLGHTRLARRPTLAANWAFDCIINAQLCRLHPTVEFTSFFAAGAADEGPWRLIAPPPGWPSRPRYARGALGDVHRRLYDDQGVTTAELFALLQTIAVTLDAADGARLLGNHDTEPDADPLHADAELHAEVRRLVARWPMVEHRGGVDDGQDATARQDALARHAAARREVRRLLRVAAWGSAGGPPRLREVDVPAIVPLPQSRDRRAQLLRLVGAQPLMWQGAMRQPHRDDAGQVTVYLDVSGSMTAWLPVLLAALTDEAALVRWPILGFSTQVHAVSRAELAAGRFRSTGGTDIACVARHLLRERVRRAVVITDGDVQTIPTALMERLGRARPRVRVGLIGGGDAGFGEGLRWPVTRLPALDRTPA